MKAVFACPRCQRSLSATWAPGLAGLACGCGWTRPLADGDVVTDRPTRCLVCGCPDLWRQKGFPVRVGVAIVALGAAVFLICQAYYLPVTGIAVLLSLALLDMLLFMFLPDVLVCYRCQTQYKQANLSAADSQFDLETAERYRQESARLAEHRAKNS